MPTLNYALKEWSVAVDALLSGQTILLLRKGGIREQGGTFQVPHSQILLYPTLEHQKLDQVKLMYRQLYSDDVRSEENQTIHLRAWAKIEKVFPLTQPATVHALEAFHIWTEHFVTERLQWKKQHPLQALLLRTYRLESPVALTWQPSFGGCRSWIDIDQTIEATPAQPALDHQVYQQQYQAICSILENLKGV